MIIRIESGLNPGGFIFIFCGRHGFKLRNHSSSPVYLLAAAYSLVYEGLNHIPSPLLMEF